MADARCIRCGRVIPEGEQLCLHCGDYDDQQRFRVPDAAAILAACDGLEALIADADIEDKNLKHRLLREAAKRIGIIRREVRP